MVSTEEDPLPIMNDAEAQQQIQQMVSFILNEARETADSIKQKANEDYNIEKLKLVQSMKDKIRRRPRL